MRKTYPRIDMHVHCRDEGQSYKTTVVECLRLAEEQGIAVIIDQPNPADPVTGYRRVRDRLALVPVDQCARFRLYVGLTADEHQLHDAMRCWHHIPEVVGFKLFMGKSVGSLSVTGLDEQRLVFEYLAQRRYSGVVTGHCEKESRLRPDLWDPAHPISHCLARPYIAELESVRDAIQLIQETGYGGKFHVHHVSHPKTVAAIQRAKEDGLAITCGVTPHHLQFCAGQMMRQDGLRFKMNPPLRSHKAMLELRWMVADGMVDVLETDHAVHSCAEKFGEPYLSGYPAMNLYRETVEEFLPALGLSPRQIRAMTCDNILWIFGEKLTYPGL